MTAKVITAALDVLAAVIMTAIARRATTKASRDRWLILAAIWAGLACFALGRI